MMAYLKGRGIDQEILDYCVQTGRIYESRNKGHSNVVFVGFDKDGKARFGCLRGISEARFHGDLSGSDKHFSFALPACVENPAVHLCECAIDVMSYAMAAGIGPFAASAQPTRPHAHTRTGGQEPQIQYFL